MRKGMTLSVASFVLGLVVTSTPALASPDYTYVNTGIYLKLVTPGSSEYSESLTKTPPTINGRIKIDRFGDCTLEVFSHTYELHDCYLRHDSTLFSKDLVKFTIDNQSLIQITASTILNAESYAHNAATTDRSMAVLAQAVPLAHGRMTEISNINRDGTSEDGARTQVMFAGPGRPAYALVLQFDPGTIREFSHPTR